MLEEPKIYGTEENPHHLWCSRAMGPPKPCKMCDGLWGTYPYNSQEEMQGLAKKHFPDAIPRN